MQSASLQSYYVNRGRMAVVGIGSFSLVVLVPWAVIQSFPDLPVGVRVASVVAGFVAYGFAFTLGMRHWAAARLRYVLDDGGLSVFGPTGQLRERVRWNDVRSYVVDTVPAAASLRFLRITRVHGAAIRIVEGRAPGAPQAFAAFCDAFRAAVAQRGAAVPSAAPILESVSFYDGPVARALGIVLMVLIVATLGGSFLLPADGYTASMRLRLLAASAITAPFIYRTVFSRKPAPVKRPAA